MRGFLKRCLRTNAVFQALIIVNYTFCILTQFHSGFFITISGRANLTYRFLIRFFYVEKRKTVLSRTDVGFLFFFFLLLCVFGYPLLPYCRFWKVHGIFPPTTLHFRFPDACLTQSFRCNTASFRNPSVPISYLRSCESYLTAATEYSSGLPSWLIKGQWLGA